MIRNEVRNHLERKILPFWENLEDEENGGFFGAMDNHLILNRTADKGCILNTRTTPWRSSGSLRTR